MRIGRLLPEPVRMSAHGLRDRYGLAGGAEVGGGESLGLKVVEEGSELRVEAALLEGGGRLAVNFLHEGATVQVLEAARSVEGRPHGDLEEEGVVVEVDLGAFDQDPRYGAEAQVGGGPGGQGRVQEDVADTRS